MICAAARRSLAQREGHESASAHDFGKNLKRLAQGLIEAIVEPRHRQIDREMARFLIRSGGRITDSMEREMTQKVLRSEWSTPR